MFPHGTAYLFLAALLASQSATSGQNPVTTRQDASPQPRSATLREAGSARRLIIGTAAGPGRLSEPQYADTLAAQFRQIEPEIHMKFGFIHPRPGSDASAYNFAPADKLVAFAQAHDMLVRGHCLVWHQQVADWVVGGVAAKTIDSEQLKAILQNHISTVAGHYAGNVWAWDVVNEAFNDDGSLRSTIWYDSPGIGLKGRGAAYIEQAFRWAHAADPKAKLFYNDYEAEVINRKSDAIYAMAKDFVARGVPIDGIGFQAHLSLAFDNPKTLDSFAANLKRFSDLGLEIHITELDVRVNAPNAANLAAQAALYGKVTTVCLQNPNCRVLQTWGFTDKYSWIPAYFKGKQGWALPFDDAYQKKPAYNAILKALEAK